MNSINSDEICEEFRHLKQDVINYVNKNGLSNISIFCSTYGIPVIAVWTYVKEDFPEYRQKAENSIKLVKEFYNYE